MPLRQILDAIEAEARAEIERIEAEARAEIERIEAEARERAASLRAEHAARRDPEIARATAALVNRARLEARRRLAASREEAFAEALSRLDGRLATIRASPDYQELVRRLVVEALTVLPAARVIRCGRADADPVRTIAPDLEVDPSLETWGGVIAETDDGRRVDNRLETRRRRSEPYLRLLANRVLPEEPT